VEYSKEKERDYQTDFARKDGSLAAPTASLHFTQALIARLRESGSKTRFLTLHVGLGTFKPVQVADIREHAMHAEDFEVPLSVFRDVAESKDEGRKVVGVGTTVTRTLESLPYLWPSVRERFADEEGVMGFWDRISGYSGSQPDMGAANNPQARSAEDEVNSREAGREDPLGGVCQSISGSDPNSPVAFRHADTHTAYGSTAIFVYPSKPFRVIDEMITNFHLPESTLFMLVSAFAGTEKTHEIYAHALKNGYRFYSFGDGMWIR
jgi:S-adenosylmethionine:tRNA ribosyltransferase-isomerase